MEAFLTEKCPPAVAAAVRHRFSGPHGDGVGRAAVWTEAPVGPDFFLKKFFGRGVVRIQPEELRQAKVPAPQIGFHIGTS